jgi:uncharacterized protein GlcG (DUF336 family)
MLTLAEARTMIDAAVTEAERIGARMNIAVADAGGNLIAHVRMDGAFFGSVAVSIDKAWTSAAFQMPSGDLGNITKPGDPAWGLAQSNAGRVMVFPGGLPVIRSGALVGAIGVSGGGVDEDVRVARAGVDALG